MSERERESKRVSGRGEEGRESKGETERERKRDAEDLLSI
jgi:hypothetical protein